VDKNELLIGEGGRRARRRPFLIGLPLFAVALLTSCGIETIPYYYAPIATSATETATSFTFYHETSNNGSDFKGYELYYRCYDTFDAANSDLEAIENLTSASSAAPDSVLYSMENTYKFSRMYNSVDGTGAGTTPLLTFPSDAYKGSSVTYIVSLLPTGWYVTSSYGYNNTTSTTYLYRSAYSAVSSTVHKTFIPTSSIPSDSATFSTSDSDYTGTNSSTYSYGGTATGATVYLVVFALGLGLPSDTINMIPSLPATFGSVIQIR